MPDKCKRLGLSIDLTRCNWRGRDRQHLDESETMTVAAALDADTIVRSAGTSGEPCASQGYLCISLAGATTGTTTCLVSMQHENTLSQAVTIVTCMCVSQTGPRNRSLL